MIDNISANTLFFGCFRGWFYIMSTLVGLSMAKPVFQFSNYVV